MRGMVFALLATVCGVGCKSKSLEWKAHTIKTVSIGGLTFDIPKGWRHLSESANPKLAGMTTRLGAATEAHIIVRESASNTDSTIAFMLADLVGSPTCEQWVAAMELQKGGPRVDHDSILPQDWGGQRGCSFRVTEGELAGKIHIRFRGAKFVTLQCMRPKSGDDDADGVCGDLVAAMHAQ
jgi:hypothetical protein